MISIRMDTPDLWWKCRTCGTEVTASTSSCQNCGKGRETLDVSRPKIRKSLPSFSQVATPSRGMRGVVFAFVVGTVVAMIWAVVFVYFADR